MSTQQPVLGLIDPGRVIRRPPVVGMAFLHEAPVRPDNFLRARARTKTERLIGFLLGHFTGVQTLAIPATRPAPRVRVTLVCRAPSGKAAVEIHYGRQGRCCMPSTTPARVGS